MKPVYELTYKLTPEYEKYLSWIWQYHTAKPRAIQEINFSFEPISEGEKIATWYLISWLINQYGKLPLPNV